jgi:hypothetical protein
LFFGGGGFADDTKALVAFDEAKGLIVERVAGQFIDVFADEFIQAGREGVVVVAVEFGGEGGASAPDFGDEEGVFCDCVGEGGETPGPELIEAACYLSFFARGNHFGKLVGEDIDLALHCVQELEQVVRLPTGDGTKAEVESALEGDGPFSRRFGLAEFSQVRVG